MTAKLAGALTAYALLLPPAHAARGDLVLKTIGNTDILRPTSRCPEGVARVRVGVQVGTRTVLIGPDALRLPVVVRTGTATFCVHRRGRRMTAGVATATASGRLTLALAGGTIEAAASEIQSPAGGRTTSYSSLATIKGGTGLYFVNVAKAFTEETYPQLSSPDRTFAHTLRLPLAGGTLVLKELARPGISSTQTVGYFAPAHALVVGDLVHYRAHAWLEGGIVHGRPVPSIGGWIADLQQLRRSFPDSTRIYGGRGASAPIAEATTSEENYLRQAVALIDGYIAGLGTRRSELKTAPNPHYAALQKLFEREFPGYRYSYLITYGVYGLANQRLTAAP